jgi:excisionase family DNA binding protein
MANGTLDCMESTPESQPPEELLTPSEVAAMFRVNPKTVTRWARSGKISAIRTLGGHRRFKASEVRALLDQNTQHG